ncbi:MAG: PorP/SprF family type IX secretion system membrane protein [Prolixibacteraceae bacterium]|nr:PorP/SprF family type IX secretion system membrane protein [Prolixibacteraceae bacterium]
MRFGVFTLVFVAVTAGVRVCAQDITFSQFYSNPLYLNPAFAGSVELPRASVHYRNQWPQFGNTYKTVSTAFDAPVEKLQGGIGIHILNDAQSSGLMNALQLDLMYTRFVRISNDLRLYGGAQTSLHQNSLRLDRLVFADNLDAYFGNHTVSREIESIQYPEYFFADFSGGLLLFNEDFFAGLACHHLNEPHQSYYNGQTDLPVLYRKYTLHFGASIPIFRHGHLRKKYDISPQVILQKQGDFKQFNYGLFANMKGLSAGLWLRQNFSMNCDALIFLVGFIKKRWHITYSYDWTISGLGGTGGSSEISLSFLLKNPRQENYLPFYRLIED